MYSFTDLKNLCIADSSDSQSTAFFAQRINLYNKKLENELDNFIVETTRTGVTIAGFPQIPTPARYLRFKFLYVTNNPSRYDARPIYSEDAWQRIVAFQQTAKSNLLEYAFPRISFIELYPTPSSSLPYTLQFVEQMHDMQYDDYNGGTILTINNIVPGNALPYSNVVGFNTSWTLNMAGRFLQISGDESYYQITGVTDTTHLTIMPAYEGVPLTEFSNTNYRIIEAPRVPEAAHDIPYLGAMRDYYRGPKKDPTKSKMFGDAYTEQMQWAKETFSGRTEMGVIPSQRNIRRFNARNPNLFPMSISGESS